MPGQNALERRENAIKSGIKLSEDTSDVLERIAKKFKIKLWIN